MTYCQSSIPHRPEQASIVITMLIVDIESDRMSLCIFCGFFFFLVCCDEKVRGEFDLCSNVYVSKVYSWC